MKKTIFILVSFLLCVSAQAQLQPINEKIIDNLPQFSSNPIYRSSTPVVCGQDTSEYPRLKATAFTGISFRNKNSVGQFFGAPQDITVHGFTFYAWMSDVNRNLKVKLVCKVFKAGLDSLPKGLALRTDTLTVDSTFGGGLLSVLEKHVSFKTPVTLDSNYVIVVENIDTGNCSIVTNSYTAGNGQGENLNSATISGIWFNGRNLNIGGVPFDADFQLYPHVTYSYKNDFTIKDQCYNSFDSVKFINDYKNTVVGSKYYNRYIYYGYDRFCFRWYNDINSFSSYGSVDGGTKYATRDNYDVRLISTLYHYRLGFGRCIDTTDKTAYYKPFAPIPKGDKTICNGDSLGLSISQYKSEIYKWYNAIADKDSFMEGTEYSKNPATESDTFYISATNNNCISGRNFIEVKVNDYPTITKVKNDSICSGANANLEVKTDGIVKWYNDSLGGSSFFTGGIYISGPYTTDKDFFVEVSNGNCIVKGRTKVSVLVDANFAPSAPTVSNDTTICLLGSNSIKLSASSSASIRWFNVASGGSAIVNGNDYTFTPNKKGVYTFYADAWNGVCGSSRIPVKVTVNDYATPTNITGAEICKGNDTFLSANFSHGQLYWFQDTTAPFIGVGSQLIISQAMASDTFYIRTVDQGCNSPAFWPAFLTVNEAKPALITSNPVICAQSNTTLEASVSAGVISWFGDTTASSLQTGNSFTTPVLFGNTKFFSQTSNKGCTSSFTPVPVTVNPKPTAGFTYSVSEQAVSFDAITNNITSFEWDLGDGTVKTGAKFTHTYGSKAIYKVVLIVTNASGCKDTSNLEINVGRVSVKDVKEHDFQLQVYPNPSPGNLLTLKTEIPISQMEILDLQGRKVFESLSLNHLEVNLNINLKAGTYLVIVKNKDNYINTAWLIVY